MITSSSLSPTHPVRHADQRPQELLSFISFQGAEHQMLPFEFQSRPNNVPDVINSSRPRFLLSKSLTC